MYTIHIIHLKHSIASFSDFILTTKINNRSCFIIPLYDVIEFVFGLDTVVCADRQ